MARDTAGGVALEVTRATLLVRMLSLVLVAFVPQQASLPALAGQLIVAVIGLVLIRSAQAREFVTRHPLVVLGDTTLLAAVASLSGADGPFVLTFMTSALLVGLWTNLLAGGIIMVTLAALYAAIWRTTWAGGPLALLVPLFFLTLWWLGYAVQRAGAAEHRSRQALRQAIAVAAAGEERTRLARELHDTLAKTLQALHLTSAALPTIIERDADAGQRHALEIQELSAAAISDARALMSELRRAPGGDCLPELLRQLCEAWHERVGVPMHAEVDDGVRVSDELVRYELLMTASEALENVKRHAKASSVAVRLSAGPCDTVEIEVADDGVGLGPDRVTEAESAGHFGVKGMTERMQKIGGVLRFDSTPGGGTRVVMTASTRGLVEAVGAVR